MTSKEVAEGFVALHVNGECTFGRLQAEGMRVFGYGLYSNDVMIAIWTCGKFHVLKSAPKPADPTHLKEIREAVVEVSPVLLVEVDSFETAVEKRAVDLADLTDKELLQELADRLIAHEASGLRLWEWRQANSYDEDGEFNAEYDELKTEHDEDWCRVRECVRFIKKDDTIWEC